MQKNWIFVILSIAMLFSLSFLPAPMVLRFYKDGPKKGQQYYGSLNFPQCQEVVGVGN